MTGLQRDDRGMGGFEHLPNDAGAATERGGLSRPFVESLQMQVLTGYGINTLSTTWIRPLLW